MRQLGALLLALIGLGCGAADPGATPAKIIVATSIPPHAWLIEQIGGDAVEVHTVLRPGESPTTHQPSDLQVSRVLSGRVFFRSGVPFEAGAWFRALEGHLEIVDLRNGVATRTMDTHAHGGEAVKEDRSPPSGRHRSAHLAEPEAADDPGPDRGRDPRGTGSEPGSGVCPPSGRVARQNSRSSTPGSQTTLAPYQGRAFVVFHPSWGYYADDYGLRQIAIETEGKEPSDSEITRIQEETRSLGVSVVFVQPQIAGQSAEAIAGVIGARLETLDPLAPDVVANLRRVTDSIAGGFDD